MLDGVLHLSTAEGRGTMEAKTQPPDKGGESNTGWKTVGRWEGGRPLGLVTVGGFTLETSPHPHTLPTGFSGGGRVQRGTQDGVFPMLTSHQWILVLPCPEPAGVSSGSQKKSGLLVVTLQSVACLGGGAVI